MRSIQLQCLGALLALLAPHAAQSQAIVGYGALTGASSVAAGKAGEVGKAAGKTLGRLSEQLSEAAAGSSTQPRPMTAISPSSEIEVMRLEGLGSAAPSSVVLRASWGPATEPPAADDQASATAPADPQRRVVRSDQPLVAASPPSSPSSTSPSSPAPASLRRGASMESVIADLGSPTFVMQSAGTPGYDKKYIFRTGHGARFTVLSAAGRVVDWTSQDWDR